MIQGGDFTKGDGKYIPLSPLLDSSEYRPPSSSCDVGTGGVSIYGAKFEDEGFVKTHEKTFLLSMVRTPRTLVAVWAGVLRGDGWY
jgi:cyclophilin family peptidyl-prolyl cis-trans isomerase